MVLTQNATARNSPPVNGGNKGVDVGLDRRGGIVGASDIQFLWYQFSGYRVLDPRLPRHCTLTPVGDSGFTVTAGGGGAGPGPDTISP